jgi:hypothetical protein
MQGVSEMGFAKFLHPKGLRQIRQSKGVTGEARGSQGVFLFVGYALSIAGWWGNYATHSAFIDP